MAKRELRPVAIPVDGESYDLLECSWCGGAAPVFADRRGRPYIRCAVCGCRSFGTLAAIELAQSRGRLDLGIVWPPSQGVHG